MKKIIFDRREYKSYKDFYHDICIKLDKDRFLDWEGEEFQDLHYNADWLDEFLYYCHFDNNTYIFKDFDVKKIKEQKNFNDYKINLIIEVFQEFVEKYPNNKLIFENNDCNS